MVSQRLGIYIETKGLSYYAVENVLNVSRGSISKAVKENKSIGSSVLEKIVIHFDDLNPSWLLTGKGVMLLDEYISDHNLLSAHDWRKKIASYFKNMGISPNSVEKECGLGSGTFAKFLRGNTDIGVDKLRKVIFHYDIDPRIIFDNKELTSISIEKYHLLLTEYNAYRKAIRELNVVFKLSY